MKKSLLIGMLFLLAFSACQPAVDDSSPATPESADDNLIPEATSAPSEATPTVPPVEYPGPEIEPTAATNESYPAPPTSAPAVEPYPVSEAIWIILPVGEQCADENRYADSQEAVAALTAAGVPVEAQEMTELMVCQACGCPTSAHYRAQISSSNLETATALGWVVEPEG